MGKHIKHIFLVHHYTGTCSVFSAAVIVENKIKEKIG
jgi:hypothetical protein